MTRYAIYADGYAWVVTEREASALLSADLIIPHPGRGHESVEFDAYTLAPAASPSDIIAAIGPADARVAS